MQKKKILIVDDEHLVRWSLKEILLEEGYEVETAKNCLLAEKAIAEIKPDMLILDYMMPDMTGLELLAKLRDEGKTVPVIILTAVNEAQDAVKAIKLGASNYLLKPVDLKELKQSISEISSSSKAEIKTATPAAPSTADGTDFWGMIGRSRPMEKIYNQLEIIARSATANVLITGESGTGKELAAQAVHRLSNRADRTMLEVNCTALTETLFASEIFGHMKGSFTDAKADKAGLLVQADKGTLFLDEIGDLSLDAQAKLLRVLEDRVVTPVGSGKGIKVDVRVVTATNRSLETAVNEGRFRRDLLHRLDIARVNMPPLRERAGDVAVLAEHFLRKMSETANKDYKTIQPEALQKLENHSWPGNVRELKKYH